MSLREQIQRAQTAALKSGEQDTLQTLRLVWSAVRNEEIDKQHELGDDEVQGVIARQVKQLSDALVDFTRGGREDLMTKTNIELAYLKQYLPTPLSAEELERIVKETIVELGVSSAGDIGKVMGVVMKKVGKQANGDHVRQIAAHLLTA